MNEACTLLLFIAVNQFYGVEILIVPEEGDVVNYPGQSDFSPTLLFGVVQDTSVYYSLQDVSGPTSPPPEPAKESKENFDIGEKEETIQKIQLHENEVRDIIDKISAELKMFDSQLSEFERKQDLDEVLCALVQDWDEFEWDTRKKMLEQLPEGEWDIEIGVLLDLLNKLQDRTQALLCKDGILEE